MPQFRIEMLWFTLCHMHFSQPQCTWKAKLGVFISVILEHAEFPFLAEQITCHSELLVQHYVDGDLTSFLFKEWKIVHLIDRFTEACL